MTPAERVLRVQHNDDVAKAIGIMVEEGVHNVVVFDGGTYAGTFGHQQLIKIQSMPPKSTKVGTFAFRPTKIEADWSLLDVAHAMFANNCRISPVFEKDRFLGIISESDVMRAALGAEEVRKMRIAEIMTPNPLCCKESDKIGTALAMMRDFRVSRLPVLDKTKRVVGVLESFDAIRRIVMKETPESRMHYYGYTFAPGVVEELPVYKVPVREIMNSKPVIAKEDDLLTEKIEEAAKLKENTVIIVDPESRPRGVLAPRDIVEWVASLKKPSGLYMQISGADPALMGDFAEAQISRMIEETVKKLAPIVKIRDLAVHFKTFHETQDRIKYSLRARVYTDYGVFVAADHGWDVIAVANQLFKEIERQVIAFERRYRDKTRQQRIKTKYKRKSDILRV